MSILNQIGRGLKLTLVPLALAAVAGGAIYLTSDRQGLGIVGDDLASQAARHVDDQRAAQIGRQCAASLADHRHDENAI